MAVKTACICIANVVVLLKYVWYLLYRGIYKLYGEADAAVMEVQQSQNISVMSIDT